MGVQRAAGRHGRAWRITTQEVPHLQHKIGNCTTVQMLCAHCIWLDAVYKHKTCWEDSTCRQLGKDDHSYACERFTPISCSTTKLKLAYDGSKEVDDWLPADLSKAFMICVGAGPWKFNRRQKVQQDALDFLDGRDLSELAELEITCYPFVWQRKMVNTLARHLKSRQQSMTEFCEEIRRAALDNPYMALWTFYSSCGSAMGPKVLSLFCRDALKVPAFPIDRHVKRHLEKWNLPVNENALIRICQLADLSPREVATSFVRTGLDNGNPNWSGA